VQIPDDLADLSEEFPGLVLLSQLVLLDPMKQIRALNVFQYDLDLI